MKTQMWVPPPFRLSRNAFAQGPDAHRKPPAAMLVELVDPEPVEEHVFAMMRQCEEENIKLDAIVLNSREYFSFRERMRDALRGIGKGREKDASLVFNGVRILMDPMRDEGEPVPVFGEEAAIQMYALRRRAYDSADT